LAELQNTTSYGPELSFKNHHLFPETEMRTYNLLILGLSAFLLSACMTMQHGKQWVELPEGLYHGSVKNELPNGNGILKHKNGSIYRGHFKNGYMHGKGVFEWKSGSRYAGQYNEGKRHGKGTYTWPNGAVYKGDYKSGIREGKGQLDLPNGKRYKGYFVAGKRQGKGVLYHPTGQVDRGLWKDDELVIEDPEKTSFFYSKK